MFISSEYQICGGRTYIILHPPQEILKIFHWITIMQTPILHVLEGSYARTIFGMILLIRRRRRWYPNNLCRWDQLQMRHIVEPCYIPRYILSQIRYYQTLLILRY